MKPQQLASLVSWSPPWTSRILEERKDKTAVSSDQGKPAAEDQQDKKSGSKKAVTWDELVHVRKFQPFEEEFARRNGSPRVRRSVRHHDNQTGQSHHHTAGDSRHQDEGGSTAFPTGWDSRYFTSPMYDL